MDTDDYKEFVLPFEERIRTSYFQDVAASKRLILSKKERRYFLKRFQDSLLIELIGIMLLVFGELTICHERRCSEIFHEWNFSD